MDPIPERRRSLRALDPTKEAAREQVSRALQHLLAQVDRGGEEWLTLQLQKELIGVRYTHDKGGVLRGVSFELNGVAVRGQEVGYKGAQLRGALNAPRLQAALGPEVERTPGVDTPVALPKPSPPEPTKRPRRKGPAR
ncbi:hypothetical protein GCM10023172_00470 [Hymenobacter ginsengisoli]|uniref:Uncharacterized protein n=1 Tax=Hymenobacter ginsengisoli TaxID=1051626 RepID=A0ABP8PX09_9BACT|nr:hypothetical protein [Hymenobacter sp. KCTC 23674]